MRVTTLLGVTAAAALAVAAPASAHRGGATTVHDVDVIAHGLDNPRHVAVSRDGDVYVAEAGVGGDPATSKSCFNSAEGPSCTGDTGAVTRIWRHRWHYDQEQVLTGLASFAPSTGDSAIGPHGVFVAGRDVLVTNGGPTGPTRGPDPNSQVPVLRDPTLVAEEPISRLFGTLLGTGRHGRARVLADLWRFEADNNPDEEVGTAGIDSNPVDVYADRKGIVVADAGGNTLLRVSRRGAVSVLALFPNVFQPNPFGGDDVPMNAVPTGVVRGPDGAYYMSQLTGFPFPIGGASIFRVDPRTGEYTTYATGFTNAMDLAFGRDGTLYVLEIDHDSLLGEGTDGALFAVPRGGGEGVPIELPAGTLNHPGGIAAGRHGDLYVSNHATEAGEGEVLRLELD